MRKPIIRMGNSDAVASAGTFVLPAKLSKAAIRVIHHVG